jgi:hypothetical protein
LAVQQGITIVKNHKRQHLLKIISIFIIGLMAGFSSQSQALDQEFITSYNGDLWKFNITNNSSIQLTTSGYNHSPILSPDGLKIAYTSIAPEAVDRMKQGDVGDYDANNIYVMDVVTEQVTLIADQVDAGAEGYLRSQPSWSPDSTQLIWTQLERTAQSSNTTLQIYDLNTSTTSNFSQDANNVAGDAGMIGFSPMVWAAGGIATMGWTVGGENAAIVGDYSFGFELYSDQVKRLEIYNPDTSVITTYDFVWDSNGSPNNLQSFVWVTYQGHSMIALQGESRWELFDPINGSRRPLDFPPYLKNKFASNSLELVQIPNVDNPYEVEWQVDDGQSIYSTGYTGRRTPAISADGTMIAWHDNDGVSTWQVGIGETVLLADNTPYNNEDYLKPTGASSVAWGATEWFIDDIISADCPNSPPTRLASDNVGFAIVMPGDPNNIRSDIGESVIGKIPAGEWMDITGASKCDENGIRYYPISFYNNGNPIEGWTAEGQGSDYWIEPFMPG